MAVASIRIDQSGHPTQEFGVAGRSRDDVVLGLPVQLRNADDTGIRSWRWEILDQPSVAAPVQFSNPVAPNPVFTPDQPGTYLVRLTVNEGRKGEVQRILVAIRDAGGRRVPAAGEGQEANWLDAAGVENPRGWQPDMRELLSQSSGSLGTDDLVPNDSSAATSLRNHQLLQEKLDEMAAANGGRLEVGLGAFYVDTATQGPLLYPQSITIEGLNRIASRIVGNGGVPVFSPARGTAYDAADLANRTLNVLFRNLGIWNGSSGTAGSVALDVRQVSNSRFEFLDLRLTETGLLVGNAAYSNSFTSIQVSGAVEGFVAQNGCNENDFIDCRASGVSRGFVFESGADAAMNACLMLGCTVETFSVAAVQVNNTGAFPFNDMRFIFSRFTSGPVGFDFRESGAGPIRDVTIRDTHDDAVTTMLAFDIGGATYAASAATRRLMRGDRRFHMMHRGIQWPVRFGIDDDVESASALMAYTTTANQVIIRAPADSTTGDITANDVNSSTNGTGTERVNFNRLRIVGPGAHVSGDWAAVGFGGSPTIAPDSVDGRGSVSVQAGAGPSANPTLTLTFADGAWPTAPHVVCSRSDALATAGEWRATSRTTTSIIFTFVGTPVNGETYILDYQVVG